MREYCEFRLKKNQWNRENFGKSKKNHQLRASKTRNEFEQVVEVNWTYLCRNSTWCELEIWQTCCSFARCAGIFYIPFAWVISPPDTSCNHENNRQILSLISFFDFLSAEFGIIPPAQPPYHYIINLSLPTKLNSLAFFILIFPAQYKYSQSSNPSDFIQHFSADPLSISELHQVLLSENCLSVENFLCVNRVRNKGIKRIQELFEDSPQNEKYRI